MTVPARTFLTESANRYSYILTVTRVTVASALRPRAGADGAAAATARMSPAVHNAALRKCKCFKNVSMTRVPLLVAIPTAAALKHGDVLLPVRRVGDSRRTERDLDAGRVIPELPA